MTPERYAAIITARGEAMTINRPGGSTTTVYGKRVGMPSDAVDVGTLRTVNFDVRIENASLSAASYGEPRHPDTLTIGGRAFTVMAAQRHDDKSAVLGWKLQVEGVL